MKKFLSILLMLCLLGGGALASGVTYLNRDELFDFKPGSTYEVTDMFENFKGVLPGDVLEEHITVQNSSKGKVRVWMQCKYDSYVETDAKDFLDQLKLTVETGDKTIFEAAANEKAQLSGSVLLGTFRQKGKTELKVTLEVPADLGNRYMNQIGVVPWTFLIEEVPEDDTPDTGDWFRMPVWTGLAAVLAAAIALLIFIQKRRRTEEN